MPGFERYRVRADGAVFGPRRQLKPQRYSPKGYVSVRLYSAPGEWASFPLHQLVLMMFGPPKPTPAHEPDHLDGDPANNAITNLEWVTKAENCRRRSARLGGNPKARKPTCLRGHPRSAKDKRGRCMICHRDDERRRYREGLKYKRAA